MDTRTADAIRRHSGRAAIAARATRVACASIYTGRGDIPPWRARAAAWVLRRAYRRARAAHAAASRAARLLGADRG